MKTYRAALVGCSRMGAFIDNEVVGAAGHVPPYSHAASYEACDRTDLVAGADLRPEILEQFGERYDVTKEHLYTDYREMIDKEQPDIVSVATMPAARKDIVVYAADHGAKALYAEKPMAASMADADAMVEAVERNNVVFNLGAMRRWGPGYDKMKETIDSGELGALVSVTAFSGGGSHTFDLLMRLNSDRPVSWVQANLTNGGDDVLEKTVLDRYPREQGMFQFEDGVMAYYLQTGRSAEWEAVCEDGVLTALRNGAEFQMRAKTEPDSNGRSWLESRPFPDFEPTSPNLRIVEDLVNSLDTGAPPRGGVRNGRASTELIFAFIESHRRGGARVDLPLKGSEISIKDSPRHKTPSFHGESRF